MRKKEISMEKIMGTDEALSYLDSVVKCLKKGKLVVEQGDEFSVLTTPETDTVKLEIETKQKGNKEKIEIVMTWQHLTEEEQPVDLVISSKEPKVAKTQDQEAATAETTPGKEKSQKAATA